MKGYVVCMWEKINNNEKLKEYALKASSAAEKYSGKFLIRGGKSRTNEGIESPRTTVLEFPNYATAIEFYDSPEYQEAIDIIKEHAVRHHQIVEGN
tara:strand:+ start:89 stop:376 length:288 start_codon:yes stop_codon:yes gene_type:complete